MHSLRAAAAGSASGRELDFKSTRLLSPQALVPHFSCELRDKITFDPYQSYILLIAYSISAPNQFSFSDRSVRHRFLKLRDQQVSRRTNPDIHLLLLPPFPPFLLPSRAMSKIKDEIHDLGSTLKSKMKILGPVSARELEKNEEMKPARAQPPPPSFSFQDHLRMFGKQIRTTLNPAHRHDEPHEAVGLKIFFSQTCGVEGKADKKEVRAQSLLLAADFHSRSLKPTGNRPTEASYPRQSSVQLLRSRDGQLYRQEPRRRGSFFLEVTSTSLPSGPDLSCSCSSINQHDFFWAVSIMLEEAKTSIMILDWCT